ncbi:uncharacterized protein C18orf19 homolog B-like [Patiria miniata]|uniref:DUF1279 domain-containing protein n=1 Tax=Patiria miniata TaxID=46514 RepID=A0A914AZI2_PATMI|nr:uncharacterized protein C18orf19 homolog B-like [Patiria miniata]
MALFRGFSKLRAVVTDVEIVKEGYCFTSRTKASLIRKLDSSQRTLHLYAPVTSIATHQHRVPDSYLLPHGFKTHPLITDGILITSHSSWGLDSGRGFQIYSPCRNSTLTQSSKTESSGKSKTEENRSVEKDSAVDAGDKVRDDVSEARKDNKEQEEYDDDDDDDEPIVAMYDETGKPLSNWTRMKMMMKAYGYVIIPVHWVIAPVWFGAFYYAVKMGVDIAPFLLKIGVSEHHVGTLKNSGASNALMAYALYKIFTPLRYTVTVGATEMTIRWLRRKGYVKHPPRKEKTYRQSLKETVQEVKDKIDNR